MSEAVAAAPPAPERLTVKEKLVFDRHTYRQCAVVVGYNGSGFKGLQYLPHLAPTDTVEGTFLQALVDCGAIRSIPTLGNMIQFGRACRTDKGVHAVRNIMALWLPPELACAAGVRFINMFMPAHVRIFGVCIVTKDFYARGMCMRRIYRYKMPVWWLDGKCHVATPALSDDVVAERIAALNELCQRMVGSHRFHNFTEEQTVAPSSQEAFRAIVRCEASPHVFTDPTDKMQFVLLQLEGQSFLYNMIRKIVGTLVAVLRGARATLLDDALDATKFVNTPLGPSIFLYLHHAVFPLYDRRVVKEDITAKYMPISTVMSAAKAEIDAFEREHIEDRIVVAEREAQQAAKFVRLLRVHNWNIRTVPENQRHRPSRKKAGAKKKGGAAEDECTAEEQEGDGVAEDVNAGDDAPPSKMPRVDSAADAGASTDAPVDENPTLTWSNKQILRHWTLDTDDWEGTRCVKAIAAAAPVANEEGTPDQA